MNVATLALLAALGLIVAAWCIYCHNETRRNGHGMVIFTQGTKKRAAEGMDN